jgi:hypothetical protein
MYSSTLPLICILQALAPSRRKQQARQALRDRLREIIQSDMGDEFDVEDISMLNYAEDLDIAPVDLMVVVSAVTLLTLGTKVC